MEVFFQSMRDMFRDFIVEHDEDALRRNNASASPPPVRKKRRLNPLQRQAFVLYYQDQKAGYEQKYPGLPYKALIRLCGKEWS